MRESIAGPGYILSVPQWLQLHAAHGINAAVAKRVLLRNTRSAPS